MTNEELTEAIADAFQDRAPTASQAALMMALHGDTQAALAKVAMVDFVLSAKEETIRHIIATKDQAMQILKDQVEDLQEQR